MYPAIRNLVGNFHTTVAQYAAVHMQFDQIADINRIKGSAVFFGSGFFKSMLVRKVLQVAFASLVANGAIKRMVDQQEFGNCPAVIHYFGRSSVLNHHSILNRSAAGSNEFGHRTVVLKRALRNFYQAGTAITAAAFQFRIIAHGRRNHAAANFTGSIHDGCSGFDLNLNIIDGYL